MSRIIFVYNLAFLYGKLTRYYHSSPRLGPKLVAILNIVSGLVV